MRIRRPTDQLAGCCWLPRFADKARARLTRQLPWLYRVAFTSPMGLDGYFLNHFGLLPSQFLKAVDASADDDRALARWFLSLPMVTSKSIAEWNSFAPKFGSRGHPGYVTFQLVRIVFYPRSFGHPVKSIFEAIDQDEWD